MKQTRSTGGGRTETRARIVDAAAELLRAQGPAAVTTRAVAQAAGVQAPAIYRLFDDKDGLLDAVAEHELSRYVDDETAAADTDDPVAALRAAWDRHVRFGLANPTLYGILADPARAARSPVSVAGLDILRTRVHRIAVAGRLCVAEQRVVELIHAAGTGAILTLLTRPADDRDPQLAGDLFDAVMRAVLTDDVPDAVDQVAAAAASLRAAAPALSALTAGERTVLTEWLDRVASV